jgi:hypothetical protein
MFARTSSTKNPTLCSLLTLVLAALPACAPANGNIDGEHPLQQEQLAGSLFAPDKFLRGFYVPLDNKDLAHVDLGGIGDGEMLANGNVAVSFNGSDLNLEVVDGVTHFAGEFEVTSAVTLELRAETSGEVAYSKVLAFTELPEFEFGDVTIFPTVHVELNVHGTADAGASASVVVPLSVAAGFDSQSDQPIYVSSPSKFSPSFGAPDVANAVGMELTASATVGMSFLILVDGFALGYPTINFEAGVDIGVDPQNDPWVAADAFLTATGVWALDPAGDIQLPYSEFTLVPRVETRVAELPGPLLSDLEVTRWSRIYDLGASEEALSLVPTDAGMCVVGPGTGTGRAWMSELDGNGNTTWENSTVVQANGLIRPSAMTVANDGDLVLVGADASSGVGMRLERYEPAGTPRWAVKMTSPSGTTAKWNAILATETNGAVLGGTITYPGSPSTRRLIFAEVDAAGTLLWQNELDLGPDAKSPDIRAIGRTPAGDILAVGSVTSTTLPLNAAGTLNNQNMLLVSTNPEGTRFMARAMGGRGTEYALSLATFPDGSYVVGGSRPTQGLDREEHASWLGRFDDEGSLEWAHTYASEEGEGLGWAETSAVAVSPEGKLYAGGHAHIGAQQNGWLMQVDVPTGMPYWFKRLSGEDEDHLNGIATLSNGLVAFGRTKSVNDKPVHQTDLWVSRTNVDGMLTFAEGLRMFAKNDAVAWAEGAWLATQGFLPTSRAGVLSTAPAVVSVAPSSATVKLLTR